MYRYIRNNTPKPEVAREKQPSRLHPSNRIEPTPTPQENTSAKGQEAKAQRRQYLFLEGVAKRRINGPTITLLKLSSLSSMEQVTPLTNDGPIGRSLQGKVQLTQARERRNLPARDTAVANSVYRLAKRAMTTKDLVARGRLPERPERLSGFHGSDPGVATSRGILQGNTPAAFDLSPSCHCPRNRVCEAFAVRLDLSPLEGPSELLARLSSDLA